MKKGVIVTGAVVAALAVAILPRVLKIEEEKETVIPVVKVESPQTSTIVLTRDEIGSVEPEDVVYLYPKMSGEVKEIHVKTGDVVEEDQLLCVIDTKMLDSASLNLAAAETALSDARTNYNRQQALYAAGDVSSLAWEQAQTGLKNAQIQYDSAKINYDNQMEYTYITATIGGRIESFDLDLHDMVAPTSRICVISGEGSKAVTFYVTDKVVRQLQVGDEVTVEKNSLEYDGTITEISSMIDAATGLFKVKASVDGAQALPTGAYVKVYVVTEKAENVMTLPVDAVYYSAGDAYVYTYDEGTVHSVPVEVGTYDAERIEILSGIEADSTVITTWSSELFEGSQVQLSEQSQEPAANAAAQLQ